MVLVSASGVPLKWQKKAKITERFFPSFIPEQRYSYIKDVNPDFPSVNTGIETD